MTKVHITIEKFNDASKAPYVKSGIGIRVNLPARITETVEEDAKNYLLQLREALDAMYRHEATKLVDAGVVDKQDTRLWTEDMSNEQK